MNTAKIKAYAPAARREFIKAVTNKAHMLGLSEEEIIPMDVQGDVAIIGGQAFPRKIAEQRKKLEEKIHRDGFTMVMRAMAYTWFNRFAAIRFMELHDYLDHGFRVLSNPTGSDTPEILEQAAHVELPGLNRDEVVELRLAGGKDEELYRLLLLAQCAALHKAMPFLFEKIGGGTELLLPDNLLHSGSVIRNLVNAIPEEDWQNVEIIGWLYQFYISEKKDEVIGRVVKSEDIPAATQLFTPNWIVKYMVQNSLGRKWMMTYPSSPLKEKMDFYIEPAEQEPEVQQQLDAITPGELDPETITLLDPACGSGHILVEAYDLFKEIYQERGYRVREIPRLILEKNLYGLDIDDRAAQLSGFCLLMKAIEDDRRILTRDDLKMNVLAIQESKEIDVGAVAGALLQKRTIQLVDKNDLFPDSRRQPPLTVTEKPNFTSNDIAVLVELFEHGKTFGSLIQVPDELTHKLEVIGKTVEAALQARMSQGTEGYLKAIATEQLQPIVEQAGVLARKYDCVVANPPYMRTGDLSLLSNFAKNEYPDSKTDFFAMFIDVGFDLIKPYGFNAMVTMQSWMFLSSFRQLREKILLGKLITTMAHLGSRAFGAISGEVVQTTMFSCMNYASPKYKPTFFRLIAGDENYKKQLLLRKQDRCDKTKTEDFSSIPGSPITYWISEKLRAVFRNSLYLSEIVEPKAGVSSGKNEKCIFYWHEMCHEKIGYGCVERVDTYRFYPHNKGGGARKWYGNCLFVLKYSHQDIIRMETYKGFRHDNRNLYFRPSVSWGKITSSGFSARYYPSGFTFDSAGISIFPSDPYWFISLMNSIVFSHLLECISPTLNFTVGDISRVPIAQNNIECESLGLVLIEKSKQDWNAFETSWDFQTFPLRTDSLKATTIQQSFQNWQDHCTAQIKKMQELETENNRLFIEAYGLQDELKPEVSEEQITLARADQEVDIKRLLSYSIGCMMGRYSLDEPGLIYAHRGNEGFDHSRYTTFSTDDDGIIPVMDMDWFDDDATNRFIEFLKVTWGADTLDENLQFIAQTLKQKKSEEPEDTIRRYLSTTFFKDHLKIYKKRPIYWLFSSGKQKAFTCLVYLHRYNESTLPRMRSAYVTPLQGKFNARLDYLRTEINQASTTPAKKKLQKELETIKKKQTELTKFDEELRHYADKRISLDLDDGVKINYGKFGTLLAEKKSVTGKK